MELCESSELPCRELHKAAMNSQRSLLQVGGRAPADAVECLLGLLYLDVLRRSRRLSLRKWSTHQLLHGDVVMLRHFWYKSPWFALASTDLHLLFPSIQLRIGDCAQGPFHFSTGWWSEHGFWFSLQPYDFPTDMMGRRRRSGTPITKEDKEERSVRRYARNLPAQLRAHLVRINAS